MDDEFVENVQLLVPYILSRDGLVIKQINSMDVTGEKMLKYIEVSKFYINIKCLLHVHAYEFHYIFQKSSILCTWYMKCLYKINKIR